MGTIPRSSSHSPLATEAAYGVRLLLFWPVAFQVLRSVPATHGFPVLPFTAEPSGCPFVPTLRRDFPGRSVLQAPVPVPEGSGADEEGPRRQAEEIAGRFPLTSSLAAQTTPNRPSRGDWSGAPGRRRRA